MADDIGDLMIQAIERGDYNIVEQYVKTYGLNHCAAWDGGFALLKYSLAMGQREINMFLLQMLLDKKANVNDHDKYGKTVRFAVRYKDMETVQMLLDKGADVNASDEDKIETPLHIAVNNKHMEMVQMLLNKGADVNACDINKMTPLKLAIQWKTEKIVDCLWTNRALVLYPCGNSSYLHYAVYCGDLKIVDLILNNGHDVNFVDCDGRTPFHCGVEKGNIDILTTLIKHGANVNIPDKMGKMPIHVAVEKKGKNYLSISLGVSHTDDNEKIELIEYLLKHGAVVDAKITDGNDQGLTPLFLAIMKLKTFEKVVEILLSNGANPNLDVNGMTAFHKYVKQLKFTRYMSSASAYYDYEKELEIVKILLEHGANLNAVDNEGISVADELLHFAVFYENIELVELLLDHGANSSYATVDGMTALHRYVRKIKRIKYGNETEMLTIIKEYGELEIVKILLEHGTNLNAVDNEGIGVADELLQIAAHEKDFELVKLLLDHGADSGYADVNGMTALHFCVLENDIETEELINPATPNNETNIETNIENTARILLEHGAFVNAQNKLGLSPLHMIREFSGHHSLNVATLFLQFGAKCNLKDHDGNTPLHLAIERGSDNMVLLLLEHGANPFAKNVDGKTPWNLTRCSTILTYLLYHDMNNEENSKIVANYMSQSDFPYPYPEELLKPIIMAKQLGYCFDKENEIMDYARRYDADIDAVSLIIETDCKEEIDRMKKQKIGYSNLTYYEFLRKRTHQLAVCLNNQSIMNSLEKGDYRTAYPMYDDVINGHFIRGKFRKPLLDKLYEKWDVLFPTLPDDCRGILVGYLNNEDLEVLITTLSPLLSDNVTIPKL